MKTVKSFLILCLASVPLVFATHTLSAAPAKKAQTKTVQQRAQPKIQQDEMNLRARLGKISAAKKDHPVFTNQQRIKNWDQVWSGFQAQLKQPFVNKMVRIYHRQKSDLILQHRFLVDYNPQSTDKNLGFKIKSLNQKQTLFNPVFVKLFGSLVSNPQVFNSIADAYDIHLSKKEAQLGKFDRKILIIPKLKWENSPIKIHAYFAKGQVVMFEILDKKHGSLVYDFNNIIPRKEKPKVKITKD